MTTKALAYRFIKPFLLISMFFLILSSCDIVDSIFGSGDDDINTEGPGYSLIGTQVIGSSGGEINLDSILVNVPSGAFDENTELNIYVGVENDGFGEYGSSALYQIDGLPSTINKPISFSIKYHGTLEGDTLVAIGQMKIAHSLDSTLFSYNTEQALDSLGYLVYKLPAYSSLAKFAQPTNKILDGLMNILVLSSYVETHSSQGHFLLSYPLPYFTQAVLMGEHFETAYDKCKTMGFTYEARTSWPVKVIAKPLSWCGAYYAGGFIRPNLTDVDLQGWINLGTFEINIDILSDDLELRVTCGHEFLHLVQNLYEFSNSYECEPEQGWLSEATAVWIEEKYANMSNYVSSVHSPILPFWGWQYSDANKSHSGLGYGLSVIFKGIVDRYGDGAIVQIFKKIKSGILPSNAVDPVDAVISVLDVPVETFWHGVLASYTLGYYYNSKVNFKFLDKDDSYKETFTIDTTSVNSKHSKSHEYYDLSGELFKVKPGDLSMLTKAPLSITVSDTVNCGLLVCQYKKGSEITEIGNVFPGGSGEVILDDVKPIFDAGYELVVMVSNSSHNKARDYKGTNTVTLDIELANISVYTEVDIHIENATTELTAIIVSNNGVVVNEVVVNNTVGPFDYNVNSAHGSNSFENGVYSTKFIDYNYFYDNNAAFVVNATRNGNMDITVIEQPKSVNVNIDQKEDWIVTGQVEGVGDGTGVLDLKVNFNGVSFSHSDTTYNFTESVYTDTYEEMGNSLSGITLSYSYNPTDWNFPSMELINYTLSAGDYIRVTVVTSMAE